MRAQHAFDMKIIQQALEARPIVGHLPQAQKVARSGDKVRVCSDSVGDPVDLRGGIGMVERARQRKRIWIVLKMLHAVRIFLHETTHG